MAPDGPDQWDILKWEYRRNNITALPSGEVVSVWVKDNRKATAYATQEEADAVAFSMTIQDYTLTSKIHVWRFEQPVEEFAGLKPWRRV